MEQTIEQFRNIALTLRKNEVWRNVDFTDVLGDDFVTATDVDAKADNLHCNIPDLDCERLTLTNGRCVTPLTATPDGIIYGSLRRALSERPELVEPYLGHCVRKSNPYEALNASHYSDGIFLYVPDGTKAHKPFQILSVTTGEKPLFVQTRHLIVVGKNSSITLIQCDDSMGQSRSMTSSVTELHAAEASHVELYKMQNMNDMSGLLNQCFATLQSDATLRSFVVTLNGGHLRNHIEVSMQGEHANSEVHGLYLIDKEQQADNYVYVDHAAPQCQSNALYKGIVDDSARATFNGHVLVAEGAVKTEAFQTNRNILLTDKANVVSKPFLEIYNDDVKCSHGSTTGQIDEQALFYIRSRGISERTARTLLYYAFCDEIIQKISLPVLRDRLSDMVKKRLHGELSACADCALHCSTPCGDASAFHIDPTKL